MGVIESRPLRKILNETTTYPYVSDFLVDTISISNRGITALTVTIISDGVSIPIVVSAGSACNNVSAKPFSYINASGSTAFSIALMW